MEDYYKGKGLKQLIHGCTGSWLHACTSFHVALYAGSLVHYNYIVLYIIYYGSEYILSDYACTIVPYNVGVHRLYMYYNIHLRNTRVEFLMLLCCLEHPLRGA